MRTTTLWISALLLLATAGNAERPVDARRAAAADAEISIEVVAGSVTVTGWDGAELAVTGTLGDDVEGLEISGDAAELSVVVELPDRLRRGRHDVDAHLQIQVPRGARIEVKTVSADIEMSGLEGALETTSVTGGITIGAGARRVEAESVSGSIRVAGGSEGVEAESVSGRIELSGVGGAVEVASVSGRIEVEAGAVDDVELETVSGSIHFSGELGSGSLEAESHNGNIELLLPANLSARFEIESFSGQITNEFGPAARSADRYTSATSLEFSTGSGAGEVSVETFSGNVTVKKR